MSNPVFTQAFNFVSAVQGGVDPRTGLFMMKFPLGTVCASNNSKFTYALALNYSPLLSSNLFQLGMGMSWGMTLYDANKNLLTLQSGEQYKTLDMDTHLEFRQYNQDVVKVDKVGNEYLVKNKSGLREWLTERGDKVFYPRRIESLLGEGLNLYWSEEAQPRLEKIITDANVVVCSVQYRKETDEVIIRLWPGQGESVETLIRLEMTETTGNAYLTTLTNESLTSHMEWSLDYNHDTSVCISGAGVLFKITTPTGLIEEATYHPVMRLNPFHGQRNFPAVTTYRVTPGYGQPDLVTGYQYSPRNYLGYDIDFTHPDAENDNLYEILGDYSYSSTETQGMNNPRTITRTYNKYHLLTEQTERQGRCVHQVKTKYYANAEKPFKDQPVTFQMPETRTEIWMQEGAELSSRTEITTYTYDDFGNPVRVVAPDGTVTESTYYRAAGEDKCPHEPSGFTRLIKTQTVTPVKSSEFNDEPVSRTEYSYKKIKAQPGHADYAVVQDVVLTYCYVNEHDKTKVRTREVFAYFDNAEDIQYGQIKGITRTFYDEQGRGYVTNEQIRYSLSSDHALTCTTTHTVNTDTAAPSSGQLSVTTTQITSNLTSRRLSHTDVAGNTISYAYDALGRLVKQTLHPDAAEYTAEETWSYILPSPGSEEGTPAYTVHTDSFGNRTRTAFDGAGRTLSHDLILKQAGGATGDTNDAWQNIHTCSYDDLGRCVSSTVSDTLPDTHSNSPSPTIVSEEHIATFDAWGNINAVKQVNSGIVSHTDTALLEQKGGSWVTTTWSTGNDGKDTASRKVYHDSINNQPVKTEIYLPGVATPYSSTTQKWDGARRLREQTDAQGNKTQWSYDIYGRTTKTTYADGSVVKKQYAPFSNAALAVSISITPEGGSEWVLGTQTFDRLGRLLTSVSGGRTTIRTYDKDWQTVPSTVTDPDGVKRTYATDPKLGEALTSVKTLSLPLEQSFDYNLKTGQITAATGRTGGKTDSIGTYQYRPDGRPDSRTQDILGGGAQSSHYAWTPGGTLQQFTGVDGNTRTRTWFPTGKQTGLLKKITDGEVTVEPEYDNLMRVCQWTTTDTLGGHKLITSLTRDGLGRETLRKVENAGTELFTLTQTWTVANQIATRIRMSGGATVLAETFAYDTRQRLTEYTAAGKNLPQDPYGNPFTKQTFTFDALNNITQCVTTLASNETNTATYHFDNPKDPCQLTRVKNTLTKKGYQEKIILGYDNAGRMTTDEHGRTLTYDALGRLAGISATPKDSRSSVYGYDARNRLVRQTVKDNSAVVHRLYYQGSQLVNEWLTPEGQAQDKMKDKRVRLVYAGGSSAAQVDTENNIPSAMLSGTDSRQSVITGSDKTGTQAFTYSAYGARTTNDVPVVKDNGEESA